MERVCELRCVVDLPGGAVRSSEPRADDRSGLVPVTESGEVSFDHHQRGLRESAGGGGEQGSAGSVPDSGVTITPKVDECRDDPYEISEIGNPDVVIIKHLEPRQS